MNGIERTIGIFVDGIGAAAATSAVLAQLQGRIFGLLYLQTRPMALEEIAAELDQSKSNISVHIRGLVDWHLVRRTHVAGSRKDHYEAATDFWRVMQEIMERRFRWNLRQVLATVAETERTLAEGSGRGRRVPAETAAFVATRLETLRAFSAAVDTGLGAFTQGRSFAPETVQNALRMVPARRVEKG